uniref:DUF1758 domain-containing protein n=1 Tax=Heligmosomoides polygyrus TaxID=6339 RepID=A0A183G2I3_HELPZ
LSIRETYLPVGELTIMDPSSRELRKVPTLLDSGAECSFIDHKLAEELCLPTLGTTTLRVRTFGSDRVQECVSRKVPLEMWDDKGKPWSLELLTHETLTSTLRTPPVLEEDVTFIKAQNIDAKLVRTKAAVKPLIVLGSDQLWQLIRHDEAHIRLPSGLYLLPTRLGHLLTGHVIDTLQHPTVQKEGARRERNPPESTATASTTQVRLEDNLVISHADGAAARNLVVCPRSSGLAIGSGEQQRLARSSECA